MQDKCLHIAFYYSPCHYGACDERAVYCAQDALAGDKYIN